MLDQNSELVGGGGLGVGNSSLGLVDTSDVGSALDSAINFGSLAGGAVAGGGGIGVVGGNKLLLGGLLDMGGLTARNAIVTATAASNSNQTNDPGVLWFLI